MLLGKICWEKFRQAMGINLTKWSFEKVYCGLLNNTKWIRVFLLPRYDENVFFKSSVFI